MNHPFIAIAMMRSHTTRSKSHSKSRTTTCLLNWSTFIPFGLAEKHTQIVIYIFILSCRSDNVISCNSVYVYAAMVAYYMENWSVCLSERACVCVCLFVWYSAFFRLFFLTIRMIHIEFHRKTVSYTQNNRHTHTHTYKYKSIFHPSKTCVNSYFIQLVHWQLQSMIDLLKII